MAVYVVVDNEVHEPDRYAEYIRGIAPTVSEFGGRYLIRAGEIHFADSDWRPDRLIVIEFDELARAQAWLESERTAALHAQRRAYATSKMIVIDGVADQTANA